ncbi:helix-turn-helix transcriptional regulator [Marinobacter sp. ELB17]|uniref:helix-turn-helix transcriptional regulator n=1 Tax=Marinobacter sp. ELB17 TaxID=270374 RepID=UPI0012F52373|nr:AlpA family phage regulatory protein [Marinobacter sp. ELB17]
MHFTDTEVGNYYSVSRHTIWRWVRESKFPRGKKLSSGSTRWLKSDIEKFDQEVLRRNETALTE